MIPIPSFRGDIASYKPYSFGDVLSAIDRYAKGFVAYGLKPNMKAALFVKPGLDLVALAFALLKIGVVPVLIDGGIGRKNVIECIKQARPEIFIGIPQAFLLRSLYKREFNSVIFSFITSKYLPFVNAIALEDVKEYRRGFAGEACSRARDELIFLLFTSGSTGPPKGVVYTPGILEGQLAALRETFHLTPNDVDMPIIPALVIGTLSLGMTVVVPPLNPVAPLSVNPRVIADVVNTCRVTFSFGSPAIWGKIAAYCRKKRIGFPHLKRLVVAGAPTSTKTLRVLKDIVPNGHFFTPLGATECTPITNISSEEIAQSLLNRQESGAGFCVGHPTRDHVIQIIGIVEGDIPHIDHATLLTTGKIGEIIVKGPVVTKDYYNNAAATRKAKIYESNGDVWHRTGDVGYLDEQGRLWFCGRKSHICEYGGERYYSVQVEHCFNSLAGIERVALVNVSRSEERILALCIETTRRFVGSKSKALIAKNVTETALRRGVPVKLILFYPKAFPVDKRHHAKIERHLIAAWAQWAVESKRYARRVYLVHRDGAAVL
jgi:acyl-CoA synthetase (AMP-forming)/AMP-acid ligase II